MSSANDLVKAIEDIASNALNAENVREIAKCEASSAITAWAELNQPSNGEIDRDEVESIVREAIIAAIDAMPPKIISLDINGIRRDMNGEHLHPKAEECLTIILCDDPLMMVGPAGSGKSTLARHLAKALGLDFYCYSAPSNEYKTIGFMDANGHYVPTQAYYAFKNGGLCLIEEMDASGATALVSGVNLLATEPRMNFGSELVERHPDFKLVATANTWGHGASRDYCGRNAIDGASLDRFAQVAIDYDEALERAIAQNDAWVDYVQKIRKAIFELKMHVIVSPRASIMGAKHLRAGMDKRAVEQNCIWKGLEEDKIKKIKAVAKTY